MSVSDPLNWLKTNAPGDLYNEVTIYLEDGVDKTDGIYCAGKYAVKHKPSLKAVIDWLEKSPINIWPYANINYSLERVDGRIAEAILTIKIDCAPLSALRASGEASVYHTLARDTAMTLRALSDHVYDQTKMRISIADTK